MKPHRLQVYIPRELVGAWEDFQARTRAPMTSESRYAAMILVRAMEEEHQRSLKLVPGPERPTERQVKPAKAKKARRS